MVSGVFVFVHLASVQMMVASNIADTVDTGPENRRRLPEVRLSSFSFTVSRKPFLS